MDGFSFRAGPLFGCLVGRAQFEPVEVAAAVDVEADDQAEVADSGNIRACVPAGSSTGVNTPRTSAKPWKSPLASTYSPTTTPASLIAAVSVLNGGPAGR